MKKWLIFLSVFVVYEAGAERWALCDAVSGKYLFAQNGSAVAADEFSLKDSAYSWTFEKQPDGTVFIRNSKDGRFLVSGGKIETDPETWSVAQTHEYQRRTFKAKSGRMLELNGFSEWIVEPVPEAVDLKGRGAKTTWLEYQAEEGETSGRVQGPAGARNNPVCEAVGRMGVRLEKEGDFVAWTVKEEADGFSLRYCIPDAPQGGGQNATLSLYVNGEKRESLLLTSRHCWVYGPEHKAPRLWNDNPANGAARKFFDTARFVLRTPVKAGDRLILKKEADDAAAYYLIDMIELEKIPEAGRQPEGYLSITKFGAISGDGKDDSSALFEALKKAAERKSPGVWIPAGVFDFKDPEKRPDTTAGLGPLDIRKQDEWQRFDLNEIHLQGAGMWHTFLQGDGIAFRCAGNRTRASDFTIDRKGVSRDAGIVFLGEVGEGTEFWNLYFTRTSVAVSIADNNSRNLIVRDSRICDTFAGGVVLRGGHRNPLIQNMHVRGTGDDGLVLWSPVAVYNRDETGKMVPSGDSDPVRNGVIRNCTAVSPWVANCYHLAGGENNRIENCVGMDSPLHCGLRVSTQVFITPTGPFAGVLDISGLSLIRCGSENLNTYNGALQFEAHGYDICNVTVRDCDIYSSPYSAVTLFTKIDAKVKDGKKIEAVLNGINVHGAALYGIHVMSRTPGKMELKNLQLNGVLINSVKNDSKEMDIITADEKSVKN
jgi:hypothetical protein